MLGVHSLVPISVLTDSYKISHHLQYPAATKMVAVSFWSCQVQPCSSLRSFTADLTNIDAQYGEFRAAYERDTTDSRILYYGMR